MQLTREISATTEAATATGAATTNEKQVIIMPNFSGLQNAYNFVARH